MAMSFAVFLEQQENAYESMPADIPMPAEIYTLSDLFSKHNATLFAVGGAVRDYLYHMIHNQGKGNYKPKDVDLATDARPDKITEILSSPEASRAGIRAFPKGEAFGVISAVMNGKEFEIASFREDGNYTDGRRPDSVSFSTPAADAKRRDLTINALFYDIHEKEIKDFNLNSHGKGQGIADIKNQIARPVGNARDRFREDKLRIPRLMRFFAMYNPGEIQKHLDQDILDAIDEFKDLAGVSPERIAAEFKSGLSKAKNPAAYVMNYAVVGLLPAVFPGTQIDTADIARIGQCKNIRAVLAWLFRNMDQMEVRKKLHQLKYTNDEAERVAYLIRLFKFDVEDVANHLKHRDMYKQARDPEQGEIAKQQVTEDIQDFAKIAGLQKQLAYFLNYQPTAKAADFQQLKGKAMGDAMRAHERDAYKRGMN